MLSRTHRFRGPKGLGETYRKGKTVRSALLNVKCLYRGSNRPYRVAVVVSKKVSKSAVVRNRIRRRVYEIVRLHDEPLLEGWDIVLTVFQEQAATMPHEELQQAIVQSLGRLER